MRIFLNLYGGVAGDMLVSALYDLACSAEADLAATDDLLAALPFEGVQVKFTDELRQGISGRGFKVIVSEDQQHRHLVDVLEIIDALPLTDRARSWSVAAFELLATAEAKVRLQEQDREEPRGRVACTAKGLRDELSALCGSDGVGVGVTHSVGADRESGQHADVGGERPRTRRDGALEQHAIRSQPVDRGRGLVRVAIAGQAVRPQGVQTDQKHVGRLRLGVLRAGAERATESQQEHAERASRAGDPGKARYPAGTAGAGVVHRTVHFFDLSHGGSRSCPLRGVFEPRG